MLAFKKLVHIIFLLVVILFFLRSECWASDLSFWSGLGATAGISGDLGSMGSAGLSARAMDSLNIELLPGYRIKELLLGIDFQYQLQGQLTPLAQANGNNLAGTGSYFGVGFNYPANSTWSIQGAYDFMGNYSFANPTNLAQSAGLGGPMGGRLKAQYFFHGQRQFSVDFSVQYLNFSTTTVGAVATNNSSNLWTLGVGVSFFLQEARDQTIAENKSETPEPPKNPETDKINPNDGLESLIAQLNKIILMKPLESGFMVDGQSELRFSSYGEFLSPRGQEIIANIADVLAKYSNIKLKIEGHADSSGPQNKNQKLAVARAENVRKILIKHGVPQEKMIVLGFGSTRSIQSNETVEGRAANRRVEIYINQ